MIRFALLIALLLSTPLAAQEMPTRPPLTNKEIEASFDSEWFGLYLQNKKIGYVNMARGKTGAGADAAYRDSFLLSLKLTSFGQKAEFRAAQSLDYDALPPFALRGGSLEEHDGKAKLVYKLTRGPDGYVLSYPAGKETRSRKLPALDYTLADAMATELWVKRGAKPGDRLVHRSFELKDSEITLAKNHVVAQKTSLVSGVKVEFVEVHSELPKSQISALFRHDRAGRTLSGQIAIFEFRRETEAQAKNTQFSQDLFVLGMVKIEKPLGNPTKVTSLVLEVKGVDKNTLPSGPRQTVVVGDNEKVTIKIGKAHGRTIKATEQEIAENLRETPAYLTSHAGIKALVDKAVGNAESAEEKVKRLVGFVNGFIRPSLSPNRPNIPDLLVSKRGDCKAYALLFTTLARAAGVPAREVSGLMYIGDDQKAFGGHAWNEVVLNGEWLPIDATFNQVEVDATHISFGNETAAGTMLKTLGKLSFRLVQVQASR